MPKMRMNQAIAAALADEMRADPSVMIMGEDIAVAQGPFKTSEGLLEEFGPLRVRDTPISEMGFTGAAVGASAGLIVLAATPGADAGLAARLAAPVAGAVGLGAAVTAGLAAVLVRRVRISDLVKGRVS